MQNTAARIVTQTKKGECTQPVLKNLHWLPVKDDIDHKFFSLAYNCFSDTALQYLQELIHCYEPPQSLQSSSQSCLGVLRVDENHTKQQFGFRAFSKSAPKLRNALSLVLRNSESSSVFAGNLRLIYFQASYCTIIHLLVSFSVFSFVLSSGKEAAPVCAMSMAFPWVFERSTN